MDWCFVPKGDARNSSCGWFSGSYKSGNQAVIIPFEINEPDKSLQIYRNADEKLFAGCRSYV
jgi:hypothetical protein